MRKKVLVVLLVLCVAAFSFAAVACLETPDNGGTETPGTETPGGDDKYPDFEPFEYEPNADGAYTVTGYSGFDDDVTIPAEYNGKPVTAVGDEAFRDNGNIIGINMPSITSVGTLAFYGCHSLRRVSMPSVTDVAERAFDYCYNLADISMPSVVNIGEQAFDGCKSLTSVTIPDTVTTVSAAAFSFCEGLTSVTLPDGLTVIGDYAFAHCVSLKSIAIPDSVAYIGEGAFSDCKNLTSITIPSGITEIKKFTFNNCAKLREAFIPVGVTAIGDSAFAGCVAMTSITIPSTVATIGIFAFEGCYRLVEVINLSALEIKKTSDAHGRLGYYARDIYKKVPEVSKLTNDNGFVIYIDNFRNERTVIGYFGEKKVITVPDGVTHVVSEAFKGEYGVTEITIGNGVKSIGSYAFPESLEKVAIGSGVSVLGDYTFADCVNLTDVTLTDGLIEIYGSAFFNCGFESIAIPGSVEKIAIDAFYGCKSLKTIEVDENNRNYCSIYGNLCSKDGKTLVLYAQGKTEKTPIIPSGITIIGESAFSACDNITELTIPDDVTDIETDTFVYCRNLKSVTFGKNVKRIDYNAFSRCESLTRVTLNDKIERISPRVFSECEKLEYNRYDNALYLGSADNPYHALMKAENAGIESCEINENTVVIAGEAFSDCKRLTNVAIPGAVVTIDVNAFSGCTGLERIAVPDSIVTMGDGAFKYCDGLKRVDITDLAAWCNIIFENIYNTTDSNPLFFAHDLYVNGGKLTYFVVPDNVTRISDYAFAGCDSITSLNLNDVTVVGEFAFSMCGNLCNVAITKSVQRIEHRAFVNCKSLKSIVIPKSVKYMGSCVFGSESENRGIENIYCEAKSQPEEWESNWAYNLGIPITWNYNGFTAGGN